MSSMLKSVWKNCINDLRNQYRYPMKSFVGHFFTRYWGKKNRPVTYAAINQLNIQPDNVILEIGYGLGDGLQKVFDKVENGSGAVFGLEISPYMTKLATKRFALEIQEEDNKLVLDELIRDFILIQYPDNFFDGIYHVDVFYFWPQKKLFDICDELFRILKPGRQLVCAMDLKRWNFLEPYETDPLRYLSFLEPVIYKKIDSNGEETTSENGREIQLLLANKPLAKDTDYLNDPDAIMERLENEIKQERLNELLMKQGPQTKNIKYNFEEEYDKTVK